MNFRHEEQSLDPSCIRGGPGSAWWSHSTSSDTRQDVYISYLSRREWQNMLKPSSWVCRSTYERCLSYCLCTDVAMLTLLSYKKQMHWLSYNGRIHEICSPLRNLDYSYVQKVGYQVNKQSQCSSASLIVAFVSLRIHMYVHIFAFRTCTLNSST